VRAPVEVQYKEEAVVLVVVIWLLPSGAAAVSAVALEIGGRSCVKCFTKATERSTRARPHCSITLAPMELTLHL
jgi:hypothetical protein